MKPTSIFSLSLLTLAATAVAQQPTLTIYTYDSFASKYGPAPQLEANFEKVCGCEVKFMPFEDGITMFNRVRLEGKKTKADLVIGIDNFTLPEAEKSGLFAKNSQNLTTLALPNWTNQTFYPYDFGEYAFIYNKEKLANPPKSLKELAERQDLKVIYQDPRTSTVGRGFLMWVNQVYQGDEKAVEQFWANLAKHTVTIGKGWSETYGAYLKGESDVVLSYTTSPLYHQWYENDSKHIAAEFSEGHLVQIETAAILASSKQKALANRFLSFLTEPESQKIIAKSNIMKPVIQADLDPLLTALPKVKVLENPTASPEKVKSWLATWQTAVTK